jgi:hypothetical protein
MRELKEVVELLVFIKDPARKDRELEFNGTMATYIDREDGSPPVPLEVRVLTPEQLRGHGFELPDIIKSLNLMGAAQCDRAEAALAKLAAEHGEAMAEMAKLKSDLARAISISAALVGQRDAALAMLNESRAAASPESEPAS